jgi:hypothetical protein
MQLLGTRVALVRLARNGLWMSLWNRAPVAKGPSILGGYTRVPDPYCGKDND